MPSSSPSPRTSRTIICVLLALLVLESFVPKAAPLNKQHTAASPSSASSSNAGEAIFETVQQSPNAVNAHNRDQWLGALAPNASIEDPTGSGTHTVPSEFAKFHRALIEPHSIAFDLKHDYVDHKANKLVRVCDIHISFFHNTLGLGQIQPAHIVYDVDPQARKITALRANWEVVHSTTMGNSVLEKAVGLGLLSAGFAPVLSTFGPHFTFTYLASFLVGPVQSGGKEMARMLMRAAKSSVPVSEFVQLFEENGRVVQVGAEHITPQELWQRWVGEHTQEVRFVGKPVTSGWRTTVPFERLDTTTTGAKGEDSKWRQGVLYFESHKTQPPAAWLLSSSSSPKITSMYLFEEEA